MNLRDATLIARYGGLRDGETLPEAVERVRHMDTQYRQSVERLKEVGARVPPVPMKKNAAPNRSASQRTASRRRSAQHNTTKANAK